MSEWKFMFGIVAIMFFITAAILLIDLGYVGQLIK